jgi:hypothetical protein
MAQASHSKMIVYWSVMFWSSNASLAFAGSVHAAVDVLNGVQERHVLAFGVWDCEIRATLLSNPHQGHWQSWFRFVGSSRFLWLLTKRMGSESGWSSIWIMLVGAQWVWNDKSLTVGSSLDPSSTTQARESSLAHLGCSHLLPL